MSDRHQELLRQRALVQDHLAWLDREIAASGSSTPSTTPPTARYALKPVPPPPAPSAPSSSGYLAGQSAAIARHAAEARAASAHSSPRTELNPAVAATADAIIDEYRVPPDTLKTDIRKGCLLYFFAALALVAAVVTLLYFLLSRPQ